MTHRTENAIDALAAEYTAWTAAQRLPAMSADDMFAMNAHDPEQYPLTADERTWLTDFQRRWSAAEDQEVAFVAFRDAKREHVVAEGDDFNNYDIPAGTTLLVYPGETYITKTADGRYDLLIGNFNDIGDDLEGFEWRLFHYAVSEGHVDATGKAVTQ